MLVWFEAGIHRFSLALLFYNFLQYAVIGLVIHTTAYALFIGF